MNSDYFERSSISGSKKLNKKTPIETTIPTIILLLPKFKFFSFTLVQQMATMSTESKLQDLNAMTTGKLVLAIAQV